ncbi:MAG TPA: glucosyl-3-phosphoglycerate synthase [Acidimicrobiia bacterium]|jgi:glucosyl-3-phosphoglycerate synthase|nr:glucosyl-3-phosphoglycerate synthase [Acidimicrobiia bacterium]
MASALHARSLAEEKRRRGLHVSVCLPARNEAPTVGGIVATVRGTLTERVGLVDEVVVLDDGSEDDTAAAAAAAGGRVFPVAAVLPELPAGEGKGNALWKSLFVTEGDLVCFLDADVRNFAPHFVTRLLEPLILDPAVGFVKGHYARPLHGDPNGGGRVTELVARPLLSALFPALARIRQPLGGEYAARRELLEVLPFVEGWGVELGLLIDVADRFGLDAIAERDLGVREHRNRSLDELGPQALAVLLTGLRRAGVAPVDVSSALVRSGAGVADVAVPVRERPPIVTVPAYRAKFGRELSA